MDTRYLAHCGSDPDFYTSAWEVESPDDLLVTGLTGPQGRPVEAVRSGPWLQYPATGPLPAAGWKVHVALHPDRVAQRLPAVVAACVHRGVAVKTLRCRRLVLSTQTKYAPATAAGKVVTAYPADAAVLDDLVAALAALLAGEPGAPPAGELRVPGAPVSLRYGAFAPGWTLDAAGRAVPAVAGGGGPVPDQRGSAAGPDGPPLVEALRQAARGAAAVLPVSDVRVLHRSTAGGVYRARWEDGSTVVVKEARHHTGFDGAGVDAVTRLHHEHAVLQRLSGTGTAPEPRALRSGDGSDFLVMEHLPGPTAAAVLATTHPTVVPGCSREAALAYRRWADAFAAAADRTVATLHGAGVVHRDLHPGNLVDAGDRVRVIDLESAALDGVAATRDVRFDCGMHGGGDDLDPQVDRDALRHLRRLLVTPVAVLLRERPDLAEVVIEVGRADLVAHGGFGAVRPAITVPAPPPGTPATRTTARLAAGLRLATGAPRGDDPLPRLAADIRSATSPAAAASLLGGTAGVLLALRVSGEEVDAAWLDGLVAAARGAAATGWAPGLGEGAAGVALALAALGHAGTARALLERTVPPTLPTPWWSTGRIGVMVAQGEIACALGVPTDLAARWQVPLSALAAAVRDPAEPAGLRPGLLQGWAGVALGLLRLAELLGLRPEVLGGDGDLVARCRALARSALDRELGAQTTVGNGRFARDGGKAMPYLGFGSAAAAIALTAPGLPPAPGDGEVLEALLATLRRPVTLGAGVLRGRAGLLLALERAAPGDPAVDHHRDRLGWHCVAPRENRRRTAVPAALLVLGEQNLRCSGDLGTGAAGVMVALETATPDPLHHVLALPRAAATGVDRAAARPADPARSTGTG